jgi:hypothetical protein
LEFAAKIYGGKDYCEEVLGQETKRSVVVHYSATIEDIQNFDVV